MSQEQFPQPDISALDDVQTLESSEDGSLREAQLNSEAAGIKSKWSPIQRIAFRFAFVYLLLYTFPFPFGTLPGTEVIVAPYEKVWQTIVPWVADHVLHLGYQFSMVDTGSGDRAYDWVRTLCYILIAFIATIIWTLRVRKPRNYDRMHAWLRLYVRLYLGATMIGYGAYKVIQSQFKPPNLSRLAQPYGDSSPMGLLWTFMGASHSYNVFTGAAEMVGGMLLFVPSLVTLGALITIAAMGNVFILNLSYDVPVKLFSFNLIIMGVFVALPDAKRLANVLVFNRRADPVEVRPWFKRAKLNRGLLWLQLVLLIVFTGATLFQAWQDSKFWEDQIVAPAIYGIWSVDEFAIDGQPRPLTMTDPKRWQRVILEYSSRLSVQLLDAPLQRYALELDPKNQTMKLSNRDEPNWSASFKYETPQSGLMIFKGELGGHPFEAKMHRRDPATFRLTSREFHWINEYPFNR